MNFRSDQRYLTNVNVLLSQPQVPTHNFEPIFYGSFIHKGSEPVPPDK